MQAQTVFEDTTGGKSYGTTTAVPASTTTPPVVQIPPGEVTGEMKQDVQDDITKEALKEEAVNQQKLDFLVEQSQKILFQTKGEFPFDFFPDTLTIEPNQIHVTTRAFFKSARVHSIALKDISDVFIETAPMYATLKIIDRNFIENQVIVPFLKKENAVKAQRIIQGLIVAEREGVDLSKVLDDSLVEKLETLGTPQTPKEKA
jgi:hypothetical protein